MGTKNSRSGPSPPYPWIVAHRGAHDEAPENTWPAFDAALSAGADGIEFDVQLSADGIPVIWHDRTLVRLGAGRRYASDLTAAELAGLDAGRLAGKEFRGTGLPTLKEMIRRYSDKTHLLVEIKSRDRDRRANRHKRLTALIVEALSAVRSQKDFFLLSFDREVLREACRLQPKWRYVLNIEDPSSLPAERELKRLPLFGCTLPVRRLTAAVGRNLRRRGLVVMTYACNRPHQVRRALAAGADVIMSDVPGKARSFLRREMTK